MYLHYDNFSETGAPMVLVPQSVIKHYGEPSVNSEALGELFEQDLNLSAKDIKLKFYGGSALGEIPSPFDVWRLGFKTPYSNTLHIPVWNVGSSNITPMSKVISHGIAMSEKQSQRLGRRYLATELAAGSGALAGVGVALESFIPSFMGGLGLGAVLLGKIDGYKSMGIDTHQTPETHALRKKHDSDIVFPNQRGLRYKNIQ